MRISDWSSDVCSSDLARAFGFYLKAQIVPDAAQPDLLARARLVSVAPASETEQDLRAAIRTRRTYRAPFESRRPGQRLLRNLRLAARQEGATLSFVHRADAKRLVAGLRSEEHTYELQSLMLISNAEFGIKNKD